MKTLLEYLSKTGNLNTIRRVSLNKANIVIYRPLDDINNRVYANLKTSWVADNIRDFERYNYIEALTGDVRNLGNDILEYIGTSSKNADKYLLISYIPKGDKFVSVEGFLIFPPDVLDPQVKHATIIVSTDDLPRKTNTNSCQKLINIMGANNICYSR